MAISIPTTPALLALDPERVSASCWNAFVAAAPNGHLLQSWEWGDVKAGFGWQVERVAVGRGGEIVAAAQVLYRPTPVGAIAYVARGPAVGFADRATAAALFDALHEQARRRGAIFLRIEPHESGPLDLADLGFVRTGEFIQPRSTYQVDVTADLAVVRSRMKAKTRYNIGLAARRGVTVRAALESDLPSFYRALQVTSRRDGFAIHSLEYYRHALRTLGGRAGLLLAELQGDVLGGVFLAAFGREAIFLYGASTNRHRNLMPNHILQWEAIRWAQAGGCAVYDLWGITDGSVPDPSDPQSAGEETDLRGVERFKAGFGGRAVRYAGAYDHVYAPARAFLWRQLAPRLTILRRHLVRAYYERAAERRVPRRETPATGERRGHP
ncbi:MAG: peptidoglycan bridge formation glycyltransferase FemA/FemB family protein [Chloroflexi bacterium]|nr:peptidoglycan bridge formation glycyltransferase FemA/FemB family protein [Chloroflexota bacterium]